MDCSWPGSSVHGISWARFLKWIAISFSRGSSQFKDQTPISCIGRQVLYHWATREAQLFHYLLLLSIYYLYYLLLSLFLRLFTILHLYGRNTVYSQVLSFMESIATGSTSVHSTKYRWKIFLKYFQKVPKKQNLNLLHASNYQYLYSIYIY